MMRLGDTPVPIPNTTVKTQAVDGTWWAAAWESRWSPEFNFFKMSNLLWWVWRSWLARQIVALEAVGSNPTIHPFYGSLAQSVEHWTFNPGVPGSSPG